MGTRTTLRAAGGDAAARSVWFWLALQWLLLGFICNSEAPVKRLVLVSYCLSASLTYVSSPASSLRTATP